jgi:hypothetical protein
MGGAGHFQLSALAKGNGPLVFGRILQCACHCLVRPAWLFTASEREWRRATAGFLRHAAACSRLFCSGNPGRLGLVIGEPGSSLQNLFVCVESQYQLLFFSLARTELKGRATSFSPMPRNPPTPMITAVTRPSLSIRMSSTRLILLSDGS